MVLRIPVLHFPALQNGPPFPDLALSEILALQIPVLLFPILHFQRSHPLAYLLTHVLVLSFVVVYTVTTIRSDLWTTVRANQSLTVSESTNMSTRSSSPRDDAVGLLSRTRSSNRWLITVYFAERDYSAHVQAIGKSFFLTKSHFLGLLRSTCNTDGYVGQPRRGRVVSVLVQLVYFAARQNSANFLRLLRSPNDVYVATPEIRSVVDDYIGLLRNTRFDGFFAENLYRFTSRNRSSSPTTGHSLSTSGRTARSPTSRWTPTSLLLPLSRRSSDCPISRKKDWLAIQYTRSIV